MEFKRPAGVSYPQIYSTFKVKSKDGDDEEFYIQDLTENFFDEAVNVIVENHAKGAVFHKAARTLGDSSGFQRVQTHYRRVFEEKISLICLKKGTNEIAGCNALTLKTRADLIKPDVEKTF